LLLLPGSAITLKNAYARITKRLVNAIFEVNQSRVIVDSSKSAYGFAWRAAALHKLCGFDVRIIHLVRDGRGVMHSKIKGNDRKLRAGLPAEERLAAYRGLAGWIIANCVSIITRYFLPRGCYHLVKYEDLMSKPEAELKKLGHFLQLDLSNQIGKIRFNELFDVGHLVAGNRLTIQKRVALQFDVGATDDLPASLKIMYCLFGWPILAYLSIARLMDNGGQEVLEGDGKSASVH
jgi:hypothetical protein